MVKKKKKSISRIEKPRLHLLNGGSSSQLVKNISNGYDCIPLSKMPWCSLFVHNYYNYLAVLMISIDVFMEGNAIWLSPAILPLSGQRMDPQD